VLGANNLAFKDHGLEVDLRLPGKQPESPEVHDRFYRVFYISHGDPAGNHPDA